VNDTSKSNNLQQAILSNTIVYSNFALAGNVLGGRFLMHAISHLKL